MSARRKAGLAEQERAPAWRQADRVRQQRAAAWPQGDRAGQEQASPWRQLGCAEAVTTGRWLARWGPQVMDTETACGGKALVSAMKRPTRQVETAWEHAGMTGSTARVVVTGSHHLSRFTLSTLRADFIYIPFAALRVDYQHAVSHLQLRGTHLSLAG